MRISLWILVAIGCTRAPAAQPTTPGGADRVADLDARIRTLEVERAKNAEALDFLRKVYDQQKQQANAQDSEPDPEARFAVDVTDDVKLGKVDGPATAPVTIVRVFDFACPYCERSSAVMAELVKEYAGKVRVVYMDLIIHPQTATKAHYSACAAAKLGKYKAFEAAVWKDAYRPYAESRDEGKMGEANLLAIAKRVGLDPRKVKSQMDSDDCKQHVAHDMAELAKFRVSGTPTFFINGKYLAGALPKDELKKLVDEQLRIAEASGNAADYYARVVMATGEKQFKAASAR